MESSRVSRRAKAGSNEAKVLVGGTLEAQKDNARKIQGLDTREYTKKYRNTHIDFNLGHHGKQHGLEVLRFETCMHLITDSINKILERSGHIDFDTAAFSADSSSLIPYSSFKLVFRPPSSSHNRERFDFSVCFDPLVSHEHIVCSNTEAKSDLLSFHKDDTLAIEDVDPEFLVIFAQFLTSRVFKAMSRTVIMPLRFYDIWSHVSWELEQAMRLVRYTNIKNASFMNYCSQDLLEGDKQTGKESGDGLLIQSKRSIDEAIAAPAGKSSVTMRTLSNIMESLDQKMRILCNEAEDGGEDDAETKANKRRAMLLYSRVMAISKNIREDLKGAVRVYVRIKPPTNDDKDSIWGADIIKKRVQVDLDEVLNAITPIQVPSVAPPDRTSLKALLDTRYTEVYRPSKTFAKAALSTSSTGDESFDTDASRVNNYNIFFGWSEMASIPKKGLDGKDTHVKSLARIIGVKDTMDQMTEGYNLTMFGYGNSGSGKSYTIFGTAGMQTNATTVVPGMATLGLTNLMGLKKIDLEWVVEDSVHIPDDHATDTGVYAKVIELYRMEGSDIGSSEFPIEIPGDNHGKFENGPVRDSVEKETVWNPDEISQLSIEQGTEYGTFEYMDNIVTKINEHRRKENRILPTPNNPTSSRSNLIVVFKLEFESGVQSRFNIVDLAGREEISTITTDIQPEVTEAARKLSKLKITGEDLLERQSSHINATLNAVQDFMKGKGKDTTSAAPENSSTTPKCYITTRILEHLEQFGKSKSMKPMKYLMFANINGAADLEMERHTLEFARDLQ